MKTVTSDLYVLLDQAYAFFNQALFASELPPVAITLQRKKAAYGYFHAKKFQSKTGQESSEIALNPDAFLKRDERTILSTLVHEMVHVWQHEFGKPSRNSYHNKEWARKMKQVGLIASDTAEPGGKSTGQRVSHYIEANGPFDVQCKMFIQDNHAAITWGSVRDQTSSALKPVSKVKFTCPACGQNAWAKPTASLKCGLCDEAMLGEALDD